MSQTTKLIVNLDERSYPIIIGQNLFTDNILRSFVQAEQVCIVSNETVAPLYLEKIKSGLNDLQVDEVMLKDGEQYKTLTSLNQIFDVLLQAKHRRNTTLIALGGGVIGDLTGFAAACYQRGVSFIQVPTTLLSQVDASVGGKTAVNHPLGKNMIGAFHQPKAVIIDIDTLQSLPDREFRAGLAEIIKAALLQDEAFFDWLETHMDKLLGKEEAALIHAVKQSCAIKIKIVVADEKEANIRALLNLGHTFAHGIEHILGYGYWLHGEAVAVGLVLAADYSHRIGWLDSEGLLRIKNLLTMAQLPIRLPQSVSVSQLLDAMSTDKKKDTKDLKLVLLKGIGQAILNSHIDLKLLEETIIQNQS